MSNIFGDFCSTCPRTLDGEAAMRSGMCFSCFERALVSLDTFLAGNVNALAGILVSTAIMFDRRTIVKFAAHLSSWLSKSEVGTAFEKWWVGGKAADGSAIQGSVTPWRGDKRTIVDFVRFVRRAYDESVMKRAGDSVRSSFKREVTPQSVADLAVDMNAHDPKASEKKRDCKALSAEKLAATIKRMHLDCDADEMAIANFAAEIEASPANVNVDRLASGYVKRMLNAMTDEQRDAIGARPAKAPTKKGRTKSVDSERQPDAKPHTADIVVHGEPTKLEIVGIPKAEAAEQGEVVIIEDKKEGGEA
jgi:hypothetical protein